MLQKLKHIFYVMNHKSFGISSSHCIGDRSSTTARDSLFHPKTKRNGGYFFYTYDDMEVG